MPWSKLHKSKRLSSSAAKPFASASILVKRAIQVHAVDGGGQVLTARALQRDKFIAWCTQLPAGCTAAMETSSSSPHWARKLIALGLDARIIAAQLVNPYRKQGASGKNDAHDAAAICEAASRP